MNAQPDGVVYLGNHICLGYKGSMPPSTTISLNPEVYIIADNAFASCVNLSAIAFNEKVKIIGEYAFNRCTNLKSVKIPNSIEKIWRYAFELCTGLESLSIGDSEKATDHIIDKQSYAIDVETFYKCDNIKYLELGNVINGFHKHYLTWDKIETLKIGATIRNLSEIISFGTNLTELSLGWPKIAVGYLAKCPLPKRLALPFPGAGTVDSFSNFRELFGTTSVAGTRAVTPR